MIQETHENRVRRLAESLRTIEIGVRLEKDTSNLFRDRKAPRGRKLDVRTFNNILAIDGERATIDVEGMCSFGALVDATLAAGLLPPVVPQLKSITVGGSISGLGIESSSFRYGLVHETVEELEVLLGTGEVVVATPDNEYSDLFFGLPNSYGTLGYVLRVRTKAVKARPYVRLRHVRHHDPAHFFDDLETWCGHGDIDFVDGTVFEPDEMYLTLGHFVDDAPYVSDYTFEKIFYRSIQTREEDYLTAHDYIWRWDTDWFWCSKVFFAQNPIVRRLFGRKRLNSTYYMKLLRLNSRWNLTGRLFRALGYYREAVIQDVDVTIARAPEFFDFFVKEIGIRPFWICPFRAYDSNAAYTMWPVDRRQLYINFGFWDAVNSRRDLAEGHFNRLIENKLQNLGGVKSLYSDSYYEEEDFWALFNGAAYEHLKDRYDPSRRLGDLYDKCVRHH